jgi:hypothetical protein
MRLAQSPMLSHRQIGAIAGRKHLPIPLPSTRLVTHSHGLEPPEGADRNSPGARRLQRMQAKLAEAIEYMEIEASPGLSVAWQRDSLSLCSSEPDAGMLSAATGVVQAGTLGDHGGDPSSCAEFTSRSVEGAVEESDRDAIVREMSAHRAVGHHQICCAGVGYESLTRVVEYRRRIDQARLRLHRHDHRLLQGLIQHRRDPGSVWLSVLAHGHIRHRLHWTHALAQAPRKEAALPGW